MYKSSHNKEVVLDEVKLKELFKNDMISIMVDDTGNGTYKEYTNNSFPNMNYLYNANKSQCLNEKGNIVNGALTYNGTKAILTSDEGMHCILYFDKCFGPKNTVLEGKEQVNQCIAGGLYRYQGTDDVNNWICFGTTDKELCTQGGYKYGDGIDRYMYRIIGVTSDGQLALIKETGVKEGSDVTFQWNDTRQCGSDGSGCTWEKSTIYNRLNGLCNTNNQYCSGTGEGASDQTNIFLNSDNYDYLKESTWLDKINTHTWKYGDTEDNGNYDGDTMYEIENAFKNSVEGAKIGLQYIHDYYYAYPDGRPKNGGTAGISWIHLSKDRISGIASEWSINRDEALNDAVYGTIINSYGSKGWDHVDMLNGVRPVFYLKSSIKISNTAGSKEDSFIITN